MAEDWHTRRDALSRRREVVAEVLDNSAPPTSIVVYPPQDRAGMAMRVGLGMTLPGPRAGVFRKPRDDEPAEVSRAMHAQMICETAHGRAHEVFDREVT